MKSEKRRTTSKNPVLKKLGMKLTAKLLSVLLSISITIKSIVSQEDQASKFSDLNLCGTTFEILTDSIRLLYPDNPDRIIKILIGKSYV